MDESCHHALVPRVVKTSQASLSVDLPLLTQSAQTLLLAPVEIGTERTCERGGGKVIHGNIILREYNILAAPASSQSPQNADRDTKSPQKNSGSAPIAVIRFIAPIALSFQHLYAPYFRSFWLPIIVQCKHNKRASSPQRRPCITRNCPPLLLM